MYIQNLLECALNWKLETMTARRHPVILLGDTEDTDTREHIRRYG